MKVFKALYESGSNSLHIAAFIAILAAIRDVCKLVVKELTSWVCLCECFLCSIPLLIFLIGYRAVFIFCIMFNSLQLTSSLLL